MVSRKVVAVVLLSLASAFGTVSGCLGINSLVKGYQNAAHQKSLAPPGVTLDINFNDLLAVGWIVCLFNGIFLSTTATIVQLRLQFSKRPFTRRERKLEVILLGLFTFVCFVTIIPYTIIARTRAAQVTAFIGDVQLPDALVQQTIAASGSSPFYWSNNYVQWTVIVPWFTVPFGILGTIALSGVPTTEPAATTTSHTTSSPSASNEKIEPITQKETV